MEWADVAAYYGMSAHASETPVGMEGQTKENHLRNIKLPSGLVDFRGLS